VADELRIQRVVTLAVMAMAAVIGTLLVVTGPGDADPPAVVVAAANGGVDTTGSPASTNADASATTTTTIRAAASAPATTMATADPGALPQTDERPSASGATFTAGVDDLWQAIRQDRPELARPFFFPKSAYLQVKAIDDPAGDYDTRLLAAYDEDLRALHAQLGPNASDATFTGITVPDDQAVFVQPGEEYNKLPYWRVYGTTLQYELDGQSGSFPVTSLISWRGQWYVVHLGAIR
jgi:hypothetical protein